MRVDLAELNACPPLLNQKQLRRVCHISPRTAHYLLQSGAIPNERGSQYRIRREDVLAFMQSPEKLLVPAPVRTSVENGASPTPCVSCRPRQRRSPRCAHTISARLRICPMC